MKEAYRSSRMSGVYIETQHPADYLSRTVPRGHLRNIKIIGDRRKETPLYLSNKRERRVRLSAFRYQIAVRIFRPNRCKTAENRFVKIITEYIPRYIPRKITLAELRALHPLYNALRCSAPTK